MGKIKFERESLGELFECNSSEIIYMRTLRRVAYSFCSFSRNNERTGVQCLSYKYIDFINSFFVDGSKMGAMLCCMACADREVKPKDVGLRKDRGCTDVICCLFYFAATAAFFIIAILAFLNGKCRIIMIF